MDRVQEVALRMEDIAFMAGLPRFDHVRFDIAADEVWFEWDDAKLAVVVELSSSPNDLEAALRSAAFGSGDPVLN